MVLVGEVVCGFGRGGVEVLCGFGRGGGVWFWSGRDAVWFWSGRWCVVLVEGG